MCLLCLRNLKQRLRNKVTDLLKSLGHMVELPYRELERRIGAIWIQSIEINSLDLIIVS